MSISRVIAPTASLVCSVANTRWPVSEACMAMRAVSRSRTSPTRITSGSCRSTERRHEAKVSPTRSLTPIWVTPGISYSIGSSMVTTLIVSERMSLREA